MAIDTRIGGGYIEVNTRDNTAPGLEKVRAKFDALGDGISQKIDKSVAGAMSRSTAKATAAVDAFRQKTLSAIDDINARKAKIDADITSATRKIETLSRDTQDKIAALNARKLQIDADTAKAKLKLEDLQRHAIGPLTQEQQIRVDADVAAAEAKLAKLSAQSDKLENDKLELEAGADTAAAETKLALLKREADKLDGQRVKLQADLDSSHAESGLSTLKSRFSKAGSDSGKSFGDGFRRFDFLPSISPMMAAVAASIVPVTAGVLALGASLGLAASSAAAALPALLGVATGAGALILAFRGVAGALSAHKSMLDQASSSASSNAAQEQAAAKRIESAQRSLADARRAQAKTAEDGAEQIAAAQERVAEAEKAAADGARDAAEKVTEAKERVADARKTAARAAEDAADNVRAAQERVAEAEKAAADGARDAAEKVTQAKARVVDAQRAAARAAEDAARAVADAERRLKDAQDAERDAQEALTDARRNAADQLADLQRRTEDMALSQESAAISVARAQERLNKVNADGKATDLDRREAALRLAEAQQRLKEVNEDAISLSEDKLEADRKGVEGSDQVIAAQGRIADAQRQASDAERALTDARRDQADQQTDSAKRISEAQKALADAQRDQAEQQTDSAKRISEAQKAVADAQRDQAEQAIDSAKRVNDAEEAAADARRAQADQAVESSKQIAKAEKALSDAQRDQAEQAIDSAKRVADARQAVVKAQENAAERQEQAAIRVSRAMESLADAQEATAQSSGTASTAAANYAAELAKLSPAGREFVQTLIGMRSTWDAFSKASQTAVLPGFTDMLKSIKVLAPDIVTYIREIGSEIGRAASEFATFIASPVFRSQLADIMAENAKASKAFADSTVPLARIFTDISVAAAPLVTRLAESFSNATKSAAAFLDLKLKTGELQRYFKLAGDEIAKWWHILGNFSAGIISLFVAAAPAGMAMSSAIESISENFRSWAGSESTRQSVENLMRFVAGIDVQQLVAVGAAIGALGLAIKGMVLVQDAVLMVTILAGIGSAGLAIGATAVAVGSLAAAMGFMYVKSQPVRDAIDGIGRSLMDNFRKPMQDVKAAIDVALPVIRDMLVGALIGVAGFLTEHLFPALREAYDNILPHLQRAWKSLSEGLDAIKPVLSDLWNIFKIVAVWITDNLIPIIGVLAGKYLEDLAGEFKLLAVVVATAWNGIKGATSIAWNVIKAIFAAWKARFDNVLFPVIRFLYDNVVRPVFEAVKVAIQAAWTATKAIFAAWKAYFDNVLFPVIRFLYDNVVKPVMDRVGSAIKATWANVIKPVFDTLASVIKNKVAPGFKAGVDAVAAAWGKIVAAAKTPVNFVIKVLNDGIINPFLDVAGKFGVKSDLRPISYVATGGYISGPGGPTDDKVPAMLSNGEYVIRAASVAKLGKPLLDALNAAGLAVGGDPSSTWVKRFADGGAVNAVKAWLPSLRSHPYIWGGVGPYGYDCSGLTGEVWNRLTGHPSYRRVMTTLSNFGSLGFARGTGTYTIGVNSHHMVGNLGGLAFEAPHTGANIRVGSAAQSTSAVGTQWYLKDYGAGPVSESVGESVGESVRSWTNPLTDLKGWLLGKVKALIGDVPGGDFGKAIAQMPVKLVEGMASLPGNLTSAIAKGIGSKITSGLRSLGVPGFDDGGMLPPGVNVVRNNTGRPEPVFSPDQWETLKALIPVQRTGEPGGVSYHFAAGALTVDVSKLRSVEDLVEAIDSLKSTARMHGAR